VVGTSPDAGGMNRAFLRSGQSATLRDLGALVGGTTSFGTALNDDGNAAGYGTVAGGKFRGFLFTNGPALRQLNPLASHADSAQAFGLNLSNLVVGASFDANGQAQATLWTAATTNALGFLAGGNHSVAYAINRFGLIAGSANTTSGTGLVQRAFLAIPANVIGKRVTRPAGTVAGVPPQIELLQSQPGDSVQNAFHFSPATGKLYAIRPVTARVKWPTSTNPLDTNAPPISVLNVNVWPRNPQTHIAGAPVETQPAVPGFALAVQSLLHTTSPGAALDGSKVFNATLPGYSVIYYLQNEGQQVNPQTQPPYFEVARTFFWNDPRVLPASADNVIVDIGERVFDGVNDFVNCGDAVDIAGGSFALEFWAKRGASGSQQIIVNQGGAAAPPYQAVEVGFRSDNRFVFSFAETGADTPLVTSATYTDTECITGR
jgi:hypothetical protein